MNNNEGKARSNLAEDSDHRAQQVANAETKTSESNKLFPTDEPQDTKEIDPSKHNDEAKEFKEASQPDQVSTLKRIIDKLDTTTPQDEIIKEVEAGSFAKIRALLLKVDDINNQDEYGVTPLQLAISYGQYGVSKLLIENGADLTLKNLTGGCAIHALSSNQSANKEAILELLLENGADIDAVDRYGQTLLHLETRFGRWQDMALLIKHRANILVQDNKGAAALHYACLAENYRKAEILLLAGADVDAQDNRGQTPSSWIPEHSHQVKALIFNYTLLESIKNGGKLEEIDDFITKGARVNAIDWMGESCLHLAILKHPNPLGVVDLLINKGANVNIQNRHGRTPLHEAVYLQNRELFELLISRKANVNARDFDEKTPLQLAIEANLAEAVKILQQKGGRTDMLFTSLTGQEGDSEAKQKQAEEAKLLKTIVHRAIEENHQEVSDRMKK